MDEDERGNAVKAALRFADQQMPQFWDGKRLLGQAITHSLGVVDPSRAMWDVYLFYTSDVQWSGDPPPPATWIMQVNGVVVGSSGSLPPGGDSSKLPAWLSGRAEVVGAQANFAALLGETARTFVERHEGPAKPKN